MEVRITSPILAHSRSLCHASFGGGGGRFAAARSGRRVRGGEKINHGRTRTRGANACVFLNEGERKRDLSVLVCGSNNYVLICGLEKIAVRAGTGQFKDENVLVNLVDEKPVGCDMAFAVVGPVVAERMVVICGRQHLAVGEFADDCLKSFDWQMPPQHQFIVALECRSVSDGILHFARSFHICPRSVYVGWFGSCAMRSPSSIAVMVSAFGTWVPSMMKGIRFSRTIVLIYTLITDEAESPTSLQKSTKRFLVGASSENVMFAIAFSHSFKLKSRISYTKLTGLVKRAA